MITVIDNFLLEHDFRFIKHALLGSNISWRQSTIVGPDCQNSNLPDIYNFQLTHIFLDAKNQEEMINKNTFDYIKPIVEKINPSEWYRIKMNLNPCTSKIFEHGMHIDNPSTRNDAVTAIYYVNNNDGYTIFQNGQKIENVANRLVVFPANLYHSGTSCTDNYARIVLNLNFYKKPIKGLE